MRKNVPRLGVVLAICIWAWSSPAMADLNLYYLGQVSEAELTTLPSYCYKTRTPDELAFLGKLTGIHHYCRLLLLKSRHSRERDAYKRDWDLKLIIDEADYLLEHNEPDHPIVINAHLEKARALFGRKQTAQAMNQYLATIQLYPKESAAYLELARIYVSLNDKAKALDLVTEGLRQNPSKSLKRKYLELGGKEPYPTPYPDKEGVSAGGSTGTTPVTTPVTDTHPASPKNVQQPVKPGPTPTGSAISPKSPLPSENSAVPDKRYCRFCPEP